MGLVKKSMTIAAFSLGMACIGSNAYAADLSNGNYQSCTGDGTWHFVNNQTGRGAPAGLLNVTFSSGDQGPIGPSAVNNSTQHFYVYTVGAATLYSASTNLPGRLVLSDFSCDTKEPPCEKDCEPPPCDPKTDPKCVI
jgi:hypothetical protein